MITVDSSDDKMTLTPGRVRELGLADLDVDIDAWIAQPRHTWRTLLPFVYDDGGRRDAGFPALDMAPESPHGDCATRALAIATGTPYAEMYARVDAVGAQLEPEWHGPDGGIPMLLQREYMAALLPGWVCRYAPQRARLTSRFVPDAPACIAVFRSPKMKHWAAVVDGRLRDIHEGGLIYQVHSFWIPGS
jgi:hypothetical protein